MSNPHYSTKLNVAVLMATFNGDKWLEQQVASILNQLDVNISLFISDDNSTDNTWNLLTQLAKKNNQIKLLSRDQRFGSAAKNFFRLIKDVDITNYDFVAFADQDDLWNEDKLITHIKLANKNHVDGVSSNVIAFWADGSTRLIKKSQPQRQLDFVFESAGPGCTFLMTPWLIYRLKEILSDDASIAKELELHDWLAYAVCRASGHRWYIDSLPSVKYRQHSDNVIGANAGLNAKLKRLNKLRDGWYRREISKIIQVCLTISPTKDLESLSVCISKSNSKSQLGLLKFVCKARRSIFERLVLAITISIGLF